MQMEFVRAGFQRDVVLEFLACAIMQPQVPIFDSNEWLINGLLFVPTLVVAVTRPDTPQLINVLRIRIAGQYSHNVAAG